MYILKKTVKIASASGAPPPDPRLVTLAYYYNFVKFVSSAECVVLPNKQAQNSCRKCSVCFFHTFAPIFHFKLYIFVDGRRKNISCPGEQGTVCTPLHKCRGLEASNQVSCPRTQQANVLSCSPHFYSFNAERQARKL